MNHQEKLEILMDITDVYLFRGTMGTVFVMNVNSSIAGQSHPELFHPEALYEFKIDTNGDATEDMTFRVSFEHSEADGSQALKLERLDGDASRDRNAKGAILAQGYTGKHISGESGVRLWAGISPESLSMPSPQCSGQSAKLWQAERLLI